MRYKYLVNGIADPIIRVNNTINWVNSFYGGPTPFPNSYSDMIKVLGNSTFDDEDPDQDNGKKCTESFR